MSEYITLNIWVCTDRAHGRMDITADVHKEDWDDMEDKDKEEFVLEKILGRIEWGYGIDKEEDSL